MILSQTMIANKLLTYPKQAIILILAVLALLTCNTTQAGIAIGLTRAIVTGSDNTGSVQILNESSQPALIQTWIDNNISEMDKPPERLEVPFVIDLPVFRLEGHTNRRVRIFYTGKGKALPSDRESLFWLNVLEIPPKSATAEKVSEVQIAFHSRIKLFYRPQAIAAHAENIEQQLIFKQRSNSELQITNPTPFHVTFMSLEISDKKTTRTRLNIGSDDMIAPKSTVTVPLHSVKMPSGASLKILFSIIDDFGATVSGEATL